jgi:hypothetical protein
MDLDPAKKRCSFCGDQGRQGEPLVGGLGAFMCGDCVDYYAGVVARVRRQEDTGPPPWESMSVAQTGAQVDRFLTEWVQLARSRKLSWAEIGKALGVSRQAAWERFARGDLEADVPDRRLGSA